MDYTMQTCDGRVIPFGGWTNAWDERGWTWEKTFFKENCPVPPPGATTTTAGPNATPSPVYIPPTDPPYNDPCLDHDSHLYRESERLCNEGRNREDVAECCDKIGGNFCDNLMKDCPFDACVLSDGDDQLIDDQVDDILISVVLDECDDLVVDSSDYKRETSQPTHKPTAKPTQVGIDTDAPTPEPTRAPVTKRPTQRPSHNPTTAEPTQKPSAHPTTSDPTHRPTTSEPTTSEPTKRPTLSHRECPKDGLGANGQHCTFHGECEYDFVECCGERGPTVACECVDQRVRCIAIDRCMTACPTVSPTPEPSHHPTTAEPTKRPSQNPTTSEPTTADPTPYPTERPSRHPTTADPTKRPTTAEPTKRHTGWGAFKPTKPTAAKPTRTPRPERTPRPKPSKTPRPERTPRPKPTKTKKPRPT